MQHGFLAFLLFPLVSSLLTAFSSLLQKNNVYFGLQEKWNEEIKEDGASTDDDDDDDEVYEPVENRSL